MLKATAGTQALCTVLTFSRKRYELHTKTYIYSWITTNQSFYDSEMFCLREVEVILYDYTAAPKTAK